MVQVVHSSVRGVDEIKMLMAQNFEKIAVITTKLDKTGQAPSQDEFCTLNLLNTSHDTLATELSIAERDARATEKFNSPEFIAKLPENLRGVSTGGPGARWQADSRGCKYAILSKEDKATALLPSKARHEFGHFVIAKLFGPNSATPDSVRMALTGDQNSLGGFLVGEEMFGGIVDLMRAKSVLAQAGMRTILMNSDSLLIPTLQSDVVPALRGENDVITESNNTFGQIRMVAKNAGVMTKLSRELAEDAPELLAEQIGMWLVAAMVTTIDRWGLNGAGGLEPEGLYQQAGIGSTGTIGAIDWTDVSAAATAIRNLNHEPGSVIVSPTRYADLFNKESGDGVNSARNWLGAPPTLAGMQFLQSTNNPNTKAMVGDFSRYALGLRTSPLVEASTTAGDAFERHQIFVKITCRFDFAPLDATAFHSLTGLTA